MLKFNFKKISQVPKDFFGKRKEISDYLKKIENILKERDYNFPESFLLLPDENPDLPKNIFKKLIILVGIGGSSLGVQAIFEAFRRKKELTEILFLDSLNPLLLSQIENKFNSGKIKKGQSLISLISKSGRTFEILTNFFTLLKFARKYSPKIFIITDENSPLWHFGKEKNYPLLGLPKMVGGRYSVFSNLGLFPLYQAGLNIKELLLGAKEANEVCLMDNPLKNPALASALTIFYHWKSGKNIYSNFVFPPDLEFFGKWYVQLMAEGLGKEGKGITPTVTVGTSDFHAIGQLYFDGPRDKLVNFVFFEKLGFDRQIPKDKDLDLLFTGAGGKKIWQVNKAIFEGVKRAYLKKKIPFTETILPGLDERNLGFLLEMKMIEIIFLAKLMNLCAFDQPGVELYKAETRKILQG